jgi:hypothetical protein
MRIKNLILLLISLFFLFACLEVKKKEVKKKEIIKCVVISCKVITPVSIHDEMNLPLGYKLETSCGRSFNSKVKYASGDTIDVTLVSY